MTAIGIEANSAYILRIKVFHIICRAEGLVKNLTNCAKPTHGLPQIPFQIRYFLNASRIPYIGTYLNMIKYSIGKAIMT